VPKKGPADEKTKDLVEHIRDEAPNWQRETGALIQVDTKAFNNTAEFHTVG